MKIGAQLLQRIQVVHDQGLIHRDIKPGNIVVGLGADSDKIYLVDFGLAKAYIDTSTKKGNKHRPLARGRKLVGTPRYASINNHKGLTQSRREDLASIGYTLAILLNGTLPWGN